MFDHMSLGVNDVVRSRRFYDAVLEVLGYARLFDDADAASGYGKEKPMFWICTPLNEQAPTVGNGTHVAFVAPNRDAVRAFHDTALRHGGTDCGQPGLRPQYDENYFAAFVFDLDGRKIEAVTYLPSN